MKEQYMPAKMEVIRFAAADVIVTSGDENELPEE